MFWKLSALSATSPVESILDKDNFTLEELLDEEDIIQECKALNSRLVNFLRERSQVEQLLRYIVEEPPEDADSKRSFKFPFIASEIFTCEIDVILKTLVEEEELMDLLFSFLDPNRPHSALLAGYFSKVIVCLMLRKTVPLMNYVQEHRDVLHQLVDLIGITSIMEVLVRLVGADDHIYPNFMDVMQWLADSNLLEMIIDKLSPTSTPEVHANAAETLCAITRNAPSALATKLASPSFVERVFNHALEDSHSKSGLVHSLSVCISLLDPRRATFSSPLFHSFRSQNMFESPIIVDPETISAMLPKLGDLLMLLNVSSDQNMLPTTYGELRPPLGKHRLKIVEFIAVLMRTCNEGAERELINSGAIRRVVDLFFEYGFNNALHHQVESIITSCLESKNENIVRHLFEDCNLLGQILNAERHPVISADLNQPTLPAPSKQAPRAGNIGHITRISNKLVQLSSNSSQIRDFLQGNTEWGEWQANVLQNRNAVENVYRWTCGRPTALQGTRDSDDDDLHDRDYDVAGLSNNLSGDYDVAALANNLSQAFRYKIYGNEEAEEDPGSLDRDDEDVYFDDESAEVVISSLRFGDDQGSSLFTNSNWFAFQDERMEDAPAAEASSSSEMDDINLNNESGGNVSKDDDDEVVVGEDEELLWPGTKQPPKATSSDPSNDVQQSEEDPSTDRSDSDVQVGGSNPNPLTNLPEEAPKDGESFPLPNGLSTTETTTTSTAVPSMFEEDVEFVGVEVEGTEKAMEHALKEEEGIVVGEAGPMKKELSTPDGAHDDEEGQVGKELNDTNCWRPTTDHEVAVSE